MAWESADANLKGPKGDKGDPGFTQVTQAQYDALQDKTGIYVVEAD